MKYIIDVSSAIYGGHNGKDYRLRGFPVGGLRKLFGIVNAGLSLGDFILCFDGGSIIKKELLPTYKAGRIPDYSVIAQIELAKELLTLCDIPFYCEEQYEADDFVFSVCDELAILGDNETVTIYSDDRDLSCCVSEKVSMSNVTSNGICISKQNFCERVVRGREIPYNTILLWKLFHGDPSDNYRALQVPGITFEGFSHDYLELLNPLVRDAGLGETAYARYDVFCAILNEPSMGLSEDERNALMERARIVYPYRIPVSDVGYSVYSDEVSQGEQIYNLERKHMKVFGTGTFNRKKFDFYCTLLGLNKTKPARSVPQDSAEAQEFYSLLELRAKELSDGSLAVNHRRKKQVMSSPTGTLQNMELPA